VRVTRCAKRSIYIIMEGSQIPVIPAPPTGTVTFLFTDIEGSTRLSQQYLDAMPALLRRHHEILRQAIEVPHVPLRETVELHIIPDLENTPWRCESGGRNT
jgi:hypothetical protein